MLAEGPFAPSPSPLPIRNPLTERVGDSDLSQHPGPVEPHGEPTVALPLLTGVARTEPDSYVRMAAIRELGRMGDASTLDLLRANRDSFVAEMHNLAKSARPENEATLLAATFFTRTIDEAIEEIVERLSKK
jgi:HEAT repeat protein